MQFFFLLLAAALGTSATVASHAPLEINTPFPVQVGSRFVSLLAPLNTSTAQCEPLLITWSGGIRASTSLLVVQIPQVLI
ncbi:hypothetical protein B0H14DRAFT_2806828 [Mycena olivaceomarginata]|nr:hypothetical protein B0H14DRAFT_2806828 [Mycena olivaceomarginata]